jgi:hypothetical protein
MTSTRPHPKRGPGLIEFLDAAADCLGEFIGHRPETDAEQIQALVDGLAVLFVEMDRFLARFEAEDVLADDQCAEGHFTVTLH